MAQPKIHEIAKDFGVQSKELIGIFADYGIVMKNHSAKLEPDDINLIFSIYMNKYDDKMTLEEYFAHKAEEKKAKIEAEKQA